MEENNAFVPFSPLTLLDHADPYAVFHQTVIDDDLFSQST